MPEIILRYDEVAKVPSFVLPECGVVVHVLPAGLHDWHFARVVAGDLVLQKRLGTLDELREMIEDAVRAAGASQGC